MSKLLWYRLFGESDEYEINEAYLGWKPFGLTSWHDAITEDNRVNRRPLPFTLILVSPDNMQAVSIIVHQIRIADDFPLSFFGEKRAAHWNHFAIISLTEAPSNLFIIPLH